MIRIYFILLFLMIGVANSICQNNKLQTNSQIASDDSILVSAIDALFIYPLTSDKSIEESKRVGVNHGFVYPLLVLNDIIIREEKQVDCFRNRFDFMNVKDTKLISKAEAEKKGIPNVPKDGVLFVTIKKGYYFDFSCE